MEKVAKPLRTDYETLPKQRAKVMAFILSERAAGRGFPDRKSIRAHMGWKQMGSVDDCLHSLAHKGFIRRSSSATPHRNQYLFFL